MQIELVAVGAFSEPGLYRLRGRYEAQFLRLGCHDSTRLQLIHQTQSGVAVMGSVKPLNGKPYACASATTTPEAYDDFCAPTAPAIDDDSLALLIDACSELRDFYDLEQCPGRAGWLSEIIEEFKALITRVDPSQASE
jgi:hypothetical protein